MILWHSYPQHEDAHPERPWWRRDGEDYVRIDGRALWTGATAVAGDPERRIGRVRTGETVNKALARLDRQHPLPAPPPLVGQVWVWPSGPYERLITSVCRTWAEGEVHLHTPGPRVQRDGIEVTVDTSGGVLTEWPPPGKVLVAGPFRPWAPADYEVTE